MTPDNQNDGQAGAQAKSTPGDPSGISARELPYRGAEDLTPAQVATLKHGSDLEMASRGSTGALFYIAFAVLLIFETSYAKEMPIVVYGTLGIFILMAMARGSLFLWFESIHVRWPQLWRSSYNTAVLISASAWGVLSGGALGHYGGDSVSVWTVIITIGICSAGMYSLAMNRLLLRLFLLVLLLPTIYECLYPENSDKFILGLTCLAYLLYTQLQTGNINREYWEARVDAMRLDATTKQLLHDLQYRDNLTGLPNRAVFQERLQQMLQDAKRNAALAGVIIINIDGFKKINDTLGHKAGDALLREMAQRLRKAVRESDTLSRLSGDIFAVALSGISHVQDAAKVVDKLLDQLGKPIDIDGLELVISASAGISIYPMDDNDPNKLLAYAEAAMYRIKELGGGSYQYSKAEMNAQAIEHLKLESQLRRALERDEFVLYYQPKVDLETGKLSGLEALLRWCPPDSEPVSPVTFISLLEDTGLIVAVGEWALRTACRQNKQWQDASLAPVRVAVNLSVRQFREADLADLVARVLRETGLDAQWLELEITESMVMLDSDQTNNILYGLSDMGVHMSIDDFGTGYSSLAYLKRMPIKTLKIDQSFVTDITTDDNDAAVVDAVIAMAHRLHLHVVAEGVETIEQAIFLRERQCDELQGYLFSQPVPAHEIRPMLETGHCAKFEELTRQEATTPTK